MKVIKNFSTVRDGNMRVYSNAAYGTNNENNKTKENRKLFLRKEGLSEENLVLAGMIHGNKIAIVDYSDKGKIISKCDGLITNKSDIILAVTAADCVPIYFWDENKNIVAIVHAGWRGVQKMIVQEMISIFINEYHSLVDNIMVEIGPHILDCHFEIKEDVAKNFLNYSDCFREDNCHRYLNLKKIIKKQLSSVGIKNIKEINECTFCGRNKYFSYRRDKPKDIEAMLVYIGIFDKMD